MKQRNLTLGSSYPFRDGLVTIGSTGAVASFEGKVTRGYLWDIDDARNLVCVKPPNGDPKWFHESLVSVNHSWSHP